MPLSNVTTSIGDTVMNGLETYVVLEQIGSGTASIVYRVICKSGRLRNRHLVLKKLSGPPPAQPPSQFNESLSIHTTLHHPNIVSMFSAFCTSSEIFHVLEFCSAGSLSAFLRSRTPSTLLETELRGVIKSLVDALVYLKKELIVHCNINPSKIFLTNDYGLKLSGFDYAVRLQANGSSASEAILLRRSLISQPQYLAPEIISEMSLTFAVDIWSVGCVMIASLSHAVASDATMISNSFFQKSQEYAYSGNLSAELKSLITGIMQIQPEDRLLLPNILTHPFLGPSLTVKSLRPISNIASRGVIEEILHEQERHRPVKLPPFPPKPMKLRRPARHSSIYPLRVPSTTRYVLRDLENTDPRNLLCNEITPGSDSPLVTDPTRRIVSDPIPRSTSAVAAGRRIHSNHRSVPGFPTPSLSAVKVDGEKTKSTSSRPDTPSLVTDHGSLEIIDAMPQQPPGDPSVGISSLPIGTTRPVQFSTLGLNSQTHKAPYGQIAILPSHALLVDFREGQRRTGFKGNEVLLIDSDGSTISVYSAPHLSTPCCLVEPIQQFSVANLPSTYWKQYNDAGRLVSQIKQRTPKLIVYTAAAKCTLMANIPQGDIELAFNSPVMTSAKSSAQQQPSMRIRFSRQNRSLELSQHISSSQGEEWTKKSLSSIHSPPYISAESWANLEDEEKETIQQLVHFVRTCEAVEGLLVLDELPMSRTATKPRTDINSKLLAPRLQTQPLKLNIGCPMPFVANSLSSVKLPRRPPKLGTDSTTRSAQDRKHDDSSKPLDQSGEINATVGGVRSTLDTIDPAKWCVEEFTNGSGSIQTRFLPSVGWCIRYGSRVSHGGRYRIMFLDGFALDIDVDEDWAELRRKSEDTVRCRIRDCGSNRMMGERMKVFEDFISLFDDSQNE